MGILQNTTLEHFEPFFEPTIQWWEKNQQAVEDALSNEAPPPSLPNKIQNEQILKLARVYDSDLLKLKDGLATFMLFKTLTKTITRRELSGLAFIGHQIDRELIRRDRVRESASRN